MMKRHEVTKDMRVRHVLRPVSHEGVILRADWGIEPVVVRWDHTGDLEACLADDLELAEA